jgi:hypothetical protein
VRTGVVTALVGAVTRHERYALETDGSLHGCGMMRFASSDACNK